MNHSFQSSLSVESTYRLGCLIVISAQTHIYFIIVSKTEQEHEILILLFKDILTREYCLQFPETL